MDKVILTQGTAAPELDLERLSGGRRRLSDLRGKKVLVSFLRNAQCAICNLWVHTTMTLVPAWRDHGLEVLAVFESTPDKLRTQFAGRALPFEVLADPDGAAHDAFGSRNDPERIRAIIASGEGERALARAAAAGFEPRQEEGSNFSRLPSEVLVNADGTVAALHVAEAVSDHLDHEVVARFARGEPLRI